MKNKYYRIAVLSLALAGGLSSVCFSAELSLNGIVPVVIEARGYGNTMGFPVGGYLPGNDVDLFAGYWEPVISSPGGLPRIATNALIFPSANSVLLAPFPTNISWYVDKITSETDGTNVLISKISLHRSDSTNDGVIVANNIQNILGSIPWPVPAELVGSDTNYVLKFEVVDSASLTNSRTFWDNPFAIVPEPAGILWFVGLITLFRKRHFLFSVSSNSVAAPSVSV